MTSSNVIFQTTTYKSVKVSVDSGDPEVSEFTAPVPARWAIAHIAERWLREHQKLIVIVRLHIGDNLWLAYRCQMNPDWTWYSIAGESIDHAIDRSQIDESIETQRRHRVEE